jgi:Spy/CpxP family protein refolding chaperone
MGMGMWDGSGGHGMEFWKERNLTPEQQQSVQALKESFRPRWQELRTRGTAIREKLVAASPDDSGYAAATQSASQDAAALAADMVTLMGQMRAEMHAILTPEQRAELKQHMQERRQRWDKWRSRRARPTS